MAPTAFIPATARRDGICRSGVRAGFGTFNSSQQVGNALALAALVTTAAVSTGVLLDRGMSDDAALTGGYQAGLLVTAAFTIAGAAAALKLPQGTTGQRPD